MVTRDSGGRATKALGAADLRQAYGDPRPVPVPDAERALALLAIGRRTLASEAKAVSALADALDWRFAAAADLIADTPGRVVVSGLGKSGLVARKIASTLAGTGTPSLFLHAAEAMHGDLGALVSGDLLLLLSRSGDSRELGGMLHHARRIGVIAVAVTAVRSSPLGRGADLVLELPDLPEACPHDIAPTSSTAMMMALGDALAIAVMEQKGVLLTDLHAVHPGGRLGRDLIRVDTFMHKGAALPLVGADMPMPEVLACITRYGFGVAGVIDGQQRLQGIITDGDLRRHAALLGSGLAGEVMTRDPRTIRVGALAREALDAFAQRRITSVFVADEEGRPEGLVHIHDLLRLGIG